MPLKYTEKVITGADLLHLLSEGVGGAKKGTVPAGSRGAKFPPPKQVPSAPPTTVYAHRRARGVLPFVPSEAKFSLEADVRRLMLVQEEAIEGYRAETRRVEAFRKMLLQQEQRRLTSACHCPDSTITNAKILRLLNKQIKLQSDVLTKLEESNRAARSRLQMHCMQGPLAKKEHLALLRTKISRELADIEFVSKFAA